MKKNADWLPYSRTVVLLLGLFLAGIQLWIVSGWIRGTKPMEWWEVMLLLLGALWAAILLFVAIFGNHRLVAKWANWSTIHEASIVVLILAAPIYWCLKLVTQKR